MQLTGAEIICECLIEQGVDTVFGYPGGAALNTYDALYKYSDKINHILTAHEQGAAHAADGYARATGKVGVCMTTSGPGATNTVTGIATANIDSIPMVIITGNVNVDLLGRDSFQEVDIVDIVKPITKGSYLVKSIEELAPAIRTAFALAMDGRKGPVLIDVPKDITAQMTDFKAITPAKRPNKEVDSAEKISKAVELINKAKYPIIYAGGGVISADASAELLEFAEKIDAPVCCSLMGLGCIPATHRLNMGNLGMHGTYATGMATEKCDLIIAMGARFSDRVAGNPKKFGAQAEIIHIDIDENEIDKNVQTDTHIIGDIKDVLEILNNHVEKQNHTQWLVQLEIWKGEHVAQREKLGGYMSALDVLLAINRKKAPEDIIATDVGQHQMWVAQYSEIERPRTLLTSGGMGTMGFGMGAALGAQCAFPRKKVFLVTGDGSFHMNLNELVTLKSYNLPVIVVVMNNGVLGMVRQWQKLFYESRFSQTDPKRATDFVKLAEAFGVPGFRLDKAEDVDEVFDKAMGLNGPAVIDCVISPDANVLPMIPPGKTVKDIVTEM
ncbi:MAG: biosynthetic-type acetolactate synthase large subunit [Ruminococcus sp.]|jgi:acetolactate synthase-1/2/3 large subunit|nr:biosynthetic-type acetolactate synthase large subunit [Ruminococcus sp.]